jgi:hypothetical protein
MQRRWRASEDEDDFDPGALPTISEVAVRRRRRREERETKKEKQ